LIVLGKLHKFTKLELEELNRSFSKINLVAYDNVEPKEVIENIKSIIEKERVRLIVLNTLAKVPNEVVDFLTSLEIKGIKFITISSFLQKYLNKYYIPSNMRNLSFLSKIKPYSKLNYILKRFIDYTISIPLFVIAIPVMAYSAYKIKKESPDAGVLFKQQRVGINSKEFTCYKFRSMRTDIDYRSDYTQESDPRVFPWGDFMRRTRIDELPQLINVLKGDMHLVGPRAEWSKLVQEYQEKIPYYNTRHIVKPGITGWAQVKYKYGANVDDAKEKLMYDLYYIKNWSIALELKTIWLTAKVVLGKKGL